MAEAPLHAARETRTLRAARWIVGRRAWVVLLLISVTLFAAWPIVNMISSTLGLPLPGPIVRIDTNARDLFPDHPFIHAQDKFSRVFGGASTVAAAVVVPEGSIFTPEALAVVREVTRRLDGVGFDSQAEARDALREQLEQDEGMPPERVREALDRAFPPYPVNHDQVASIAHPSTRILQIQADGSIEGDVLMKRVPKTQEEAEELRALVRQNPPVIFGRLISRDEKGALITAGFVTDRLSNRAVYETVFQHIQQIKADLETDDIKIYLSGEPVLRGWVIKHAYEILVFVLATVAAIVALLYLYFRRWHGVFIPMLAGLVTTIWGLGFTGWLNINFDPLILVIPMIMTARAISHTVQMAERFFEDYEIYLPRIGDPKLARIEVATVAMAELIVPGTLGIVTDVAGLLMILVTSIPQMWNLGIFGSLWVGSIIFTVEILHPVLICYLPAPKEHKHFLPRPMVWFTRTVSNLSTHPVWKYWIAGVTVAILVVSTYISLFYSKIGEATPGTPLLWPDHEFNLASTEIAQRFGGVDSMVIYADGDRPKAAEDDAVIGGMERFERYLEANTGLGATVSVVPFLRGYWQMNHYGDPKWYFIPNNLGTVRSMIFQLRQNGPPGFMRPFMTDDGRKATLAFYYPDHKGDTIHYARHFAEEFIQQNPLGQIYVSLDMDKAAPDAGFFTYDSLADDFYYMVGPMLPPRHHTLHVRRRQDDRSYVSEPVKAAEQDGVPEWLEQFHDDAVSDYENERDSLEEGELFTWPERLVDWGPEDVDYWWEDVDSGIRAVGIHTRDLIVADLKAVDEAPRYQPTNAFTRGVQFVMAGGSMGVLAAINEEVERGHVANITLILLVIFILHSVTYQSMLSGSIILIQISTATMFSLAYMAVLGVGLNINTLPIQSVGVGIGVDYAIYIVDRIRQEVADTGDIDEAVRRAVRTTGSAVTFTAVTITMGVALWSFSNLRFQAEMAQLLVILMVVNMLAGIISVPALYSIFRPKVATALLTDEQREIIQLQKERERKLGLRDADE